MQEYEVELYVVEVENIIIPSSIAYGVEFYSVGLFGVELD